MSLPNQDLKNDDLVSLASSSPSSFTLLSSSSSSFLKMSSSSSNIIRTTRTTSSSLMRILITTIINIIFTNILLSSYHYCWSFFSLSSTINTKFTNKVLIGLLTSLILLSAFVQCEEECLRSKVMCYECESINEPYCSDPFNVSFDMSLMKMCEGCCVKIVLEKNTPQKNIWRTCTSKLQINLFMVDHVCMEESGGQGHMCFCESDGCNHGTPRTSINSLLLISGQIWIDLPKLIFLLLFVVECSSYLLYDQHIYSTT